MEKRDCTKCGEEFEPVKPYYHICPTCWRVDAYPSREYAGTASRKYDGEGWTGEYEDHDGLRMDEGNHD